MVHLTPLLNHSDLHQMARKRYTKRPGDGLLYSETIPQSTKYKRTREAKLCLIVCSMFPSNFSIPIEELVTYGMGLTLFADVHNLLQARSRILELIKIVNDLSEQNLLEAEQDEYGNQYVKTRVGAHQLAGKIASSYGLEMNTRETIVRQWPNGDMYKNFDVLSFVLKRIRRHRVNLECPQLAILQLKYRQDSEDLPVDFFDGMKELAVLSLDIPSLPESLNALKYLRTLNLKVLKMKDMYLIGYLDRLEFLTVSSSSVIHVPKQMGLLRNLRFLDLRNMNLAYISPGVLSRMLKLEELYLPLSFRMWGHRAKKEYDNDQDLLGSIEEDDEVRINASLDEILFLSLNALETSVLKVSMLPKNTRVFKQVQKFKILVENDLPFRKGSMNKLQITGDVNDIKASGICDLLSRTEDLSLIRVQNLKNVMYQFSDYDFPQLKKVIITECHELEYLGGTTENWIPFTSFSELKSLHLSMLSNLKEIWLGPRPVRRWFENLGELRIRFCHKLRCVFPLSMGGGLIRLRILEILNCKNMVGIFGKNKEDDHNHVIDFMDKLYLHSLPNLVGVLVDTDDEVHNANEVSISMDKDIATQENHATNGVLNSLEELELHGLRKLRHIWYRIPSKIIAFQKLRVLILSECRNLNLFSPRVANLLVELQKIQISRCDIMKEIVGEDDEKEETIMDKIVFPRLEALELQYMSNLIIFYGGSYAIELPLLDALKLNQCRKMNSFSSRFLNTPLLEKIQINGSLYSLMGDLNTTIKRLMVEKL